MNIRLLLPEEVLEKWSILSPFIQEALATGQGENTLADHMRKLMNFESHCWLITDNEEVLGAGLTEFIQYTRHKTLHIITIAGKNFEEWGGLVFPTIERFAKDETSILLGTMSLWQGVDVPGNSCILVAIDRIPFPRPDEPVMSARAAQADAKGGSGFMQVSLPRAALLLAQGTGRLIRSVDDRGVVAILDSRIVTKRYGSVLLNSMPPLWRTSDAAVVRDSLRRLAESVKE